MNNATKMSGSDLAREVQRAATLLATEGNEENKRRTIARTVGVTPEFVHGVLGPMPEPETPAKRNDQMPELHEVCQYIPTAGPEAVVKLVEDIRANGLREPMVKDRDGYLVDGRARWEACRQLGVRPRYRTIRTNAWEHAVVANASRFTDEFEKLVLAAKMPLRGGGFRPGTDMRPPTTEFLCDAWGIGPGVWKPIRLIVRAGESHQVLLDGIREGLLKAGTARRIALNTPEAEWAGLLERMRAALKGGPPVQLPLYEHERIKRDSRPIMFGAKSVERKSTITTSHLRQVANALTAFAMVMDSTNGLDPGIDSDLAATLHRDLVAARRPLSKAITELRKRKESTP